MRYVRWMKSIAHVLQLLAWGFFGSGLVIPVMLGCYHSLFLLNEAPPEILAEPWLLATLMLFLLWGVLLLTSNFMRKFVQKHENTARYGE